MQSIVPDAGQTGKPPCLNLRHQFGDRYRVEYEESYFADRGDGARADDPWLQIIPCARGHIYQWDTVTLAAFHPRGPTARKLGKLDFATIHQDGDDGITILLPVQRFGEVANLVKPRRRRVVTEAERARLAAIGAGFRFSSGTETPKTSAVCVQRGHLDLGAVQGDKGRGTTPGNAILAPGLILAGVPDAALAAGSR